MGEFDYTTVDSNGYKPDHYLLGKKMLHTGNRNTYQIVNFAWCGVTDRWLYVHTKLGGKGGPLIVRPISDLHGARANGQARYEML